MQDENGSTEPLPFSFVQRRDVEVSQVRAKIRATCQHRMKLVAQYIGHRLSSHVKMRMP